MDQDLGTGIKTLPWVTHGPLRRSLCPPHTSSSWPSPRIHLSSMSSQSSSSSSSSSSPSSRSSSCSAEGMSSPSLIVAGRPAAQHPPPEELWRLPVKPEAAAVPAIPSDSFGNGILGRQWVQDHGSPHHQLHSGCYELGLAPAWLARKNPLVPAGTQGCDHAERTVWNGGHQSDCHWLTLLAAGATGRW